MKHKWCEVIKAWASGEPIQYKVDSCGEEWMDWKTVSKDNKCYTPMFDNDNFIWRIKPKPVTTLEYRVALYYESATNRYYTQTCDYRGEIDEGKEHMYGNFVRWVTSMQVIQLTENQ